MLRKSLCAFILAFSLCINLCGCSDLLEEEEIAASGDLNYYAAIGTDALEETYKNEYIEVSGIVSYSGYSLLYLGDSISNDLVFHCNFTSSDDLENIEKGDLVTVRGDCSTFYASTVSLKNCRIVSHIKEADLQEENNATENTETGVPETTLGTTDGTTEATTAPTTEPTTAPTTEPPHVHSFSAATCTTPKTCSCGATEGEANGHNWKDATCSDPKTCTVCGTTSGLTAGHNFSNGKCTTCGKADPDYNHETMVWIPTNGGTKYHTHAGCSNMEDPEQVTQSEAESRGFTPCKRCH